MPEPVLARVNEMFASVQGEGSHVGMVGFFVRFAGCSLKCQWCDTEYAWREGNDICLDDIVEACRGFRYVVLTGGEPLEQREAVKYIAEVLLDSDIQVDIETNGTQPFPLIESERKPFWSISPKLPSSGRSPHARLLHTSFHSTYRDHCQFKFVIGGDRDLESAKNLLLTLGWEPGRQPEWFGSVPIYLQPEASTLLMDPINRVVDRLFIEAQKEPWATWGARVLPQVHRLIWGDRRGV